MAHYSTTKTLLTLPLLLGLAACSSGGSGPGQVADVNEPEPEFAVDPIASADEREQYATNTSLDSAQKVNQGAADPADLPASASYEGNWALSVNPGSGNPTILGGATLLEADFAQGTVTGEMRQEVNPDVSGTLSLTDGNITDSALSAKATGEMTGAGEGGDASVSVNTDVNGFFTDDGVAGTIDGTVDGDNAQGSFSADEVSRAE